MSLSHSVIEEALQQADILHQTDNICSAIDLLRSIVQGRQPDPACSLKLAEILIESGCGQEAIKLLSEINDSNALRRDALLADAELSLGNFDRAEILSDRLLKADPPHPKGWVILGLLARGRGDVQSAASYAVRALSSNENCADAAELLGDVHAEAGLWKEAFTCYERGLLGSPLSRSIALKYHRAVLKLMQWSPAETALGECCRRYPNSRRLRFLFIDILLRQEAYEAALSEIESAIVRFGANDGILTAAIQVRQKLETSCHRPRATACQTISLCMIIKDEAAQLARCLHRIKPVVDEMIVIDTGSSDRSIDIAKAFGARVIEQDWEGDFSKARNRALSEATGEWVFVLDADEAVSSDDHQHLRNLLRTNGGSRVAYSFQTRNYTCRYNTVRFQPNLGQYAADEAGAGWFPSEKVRLFPNDPNIRFVYPVHEIVEPSLKALGVPIRPCDIPVHHYGKLHEDLTLRKTAAYRSMGKKKLDVDQNDPAALREAAIQASHLGQHVEAIDLWQEFLRFQPRCAEALVNIASAYFNLRLYEKAAASSEQAMAIDPAFKEAAFNNALANLILGRIQPAISVLDVLVKRTPDYLAARFVLAACHACSGSPELFDESMGQLACGPLRNYLPLSLADLAERLIANEQHKLALRLLNSALAYDYKSPEILALLTACRTDG